MSYENKIALLITDARGIYIPRDFADFIGWQGVDDDDRAILSNPDHEHYWDAWGDVLQNASFTDEKGVKWTLYQDGDLWAIREDMEESDWEAWQGY